MSTEAKFATSRADGCEKNAKGHTLGSRHDSILRICRPSQHVVQSPCGIATTEVISPFLVRADWMKRVGVPTRIPHSSC